LTFTISGELHRHPPNTLQQHEIIHNRENEDSEHYSHDFEEAAPCEEEKDEDEDDTILSPENQADKARHFTVDIGTRLEAIDIKSCAYLNKYVLLSLTGNVVPRIQTITTGNVAPRVKTVSEG
jgi:hypothetical protein